MTKLTQQLGQRKKLLRLLILMTVYRRKGVDILILAILNLKTNVYLHSKEICLEHKNRNVKTKAVCTLYRHPKVCKWLKANGGGKRL